MTLFLTAFIGILSFILYIFIIRPIQIVEKESSKDANNTLQSIAFVNFIGDELGGQVATLTTRFTKSKDDWNDATSTITLYAHGKKLAETEIGKIFDGPLKLYARKPDAANNKEYLFAYGGVGAHGWSLAIYELQDGKLICPMCPNDQSSSCTFGGDGGWPDFDEIVNDFSGDGRLEIQEINRDWPYNSEHPNEPIRYSKEIRYAWNGSCFLNKNSD